MFRQPNFTPPEIFAFCPRSLPWDLRRVVRFLEALPSLLQVGIFIVFLACMGTSDACDILARTGRLGLGLL